MTDSPYIQSIPYRDPTAAFGPFAEDPIAAFLDSAAEAGGRGRYAYIAANPYRVISSGERIDVNGVPQDGDPFGVLEGELKKFQRPTDAALPPFQGGAVGYFGYGLGRHLEKLPKPQSLGLDVSDMVVGLYDTVAGFDALTKKAWIIATDTDVPGRPSPQARTKAMALKIESGSRPTPVDWTPIGNWRMEVSQNQYEEMVARAIDYINAGDIFQANLTQRLLADMPAGLSPFMLYRRLRSLSPAPFAAYLNIGEGGAIASASPERFLALTADGRVATRPIKGTRPRGQTQLEDKRLARDLLQSEKDQAENLMIVDLLRNDLSRVCRLGSVEVSELATLERFANVHHLVSEVTGTLFPNLGPIDLLRATFPGGSITGAPKIRAMEIINELEPSRRGPYCGAIAWIGFDGAMDSSIVIRTLVIKDGQVVAQAGGGIVADSSPRAEYEEAMDKAWALLQSLDPDDAAEELA